MKGGVIKISMSSSPHWTLFGEPLGIQGLKRDPLGARIEYQNQALEKGSKNGWLRPAAAGSSGGGRRVLAGVRGLVRPRLWRALATIPHGLQ